MTKQAVQLHPSAPMWRRAIARALDAATMLMILWVVSILLTPLFMKGLVARVASGPWGRSLAPTVLFVAIAISYEAVFVCRNLGQTPGKDVMNVRVVSDDGLVSPRSALVRAAGTSIIWLVPAPLFAAAFLGSAILAMAVWPRLAIHNALARTRVVAYNRSAEDPDAPPRPSLLRTRRPPSRYIAEAEPAETALQQEPEAIRR